MPISVSCKCGKSFTAKDESQGQRAKCPVCGHILEIPVRAELAAFDRLGSPLPATRTLAPPASAARSSSPYLAIGAAAVIAATALLGLLLAGIWTFSSRRAVQQTAPPGNQSVAGQPTNTSSPAASSTTAPPAPPAPPSTAWQSVADPPAQPITWPADMEISLPLPRGARDIVLPATPSPYVATGLTFTGGKYIARCNLLTGKQDATLQEEVANASGRFAISADGKYFAAQAKAPGNNALLRIWSFDTGKLHRDIQCDDAAYSLKDFDFAAPQRLVTITEKSAGDKTGRKLRVWDVSTGQQLQDIAVNEPFGPNHRAISPGGRYFAAAWNNGGLTIFDLQTAGEPTKLDLKEIVPFTLGSVSGVSFSPDARQLAVVAGLDSTHVFFLDLQTGALSDQFELAGKPPISSAYKGAAVEWLGGKGWCLFGGSVVDRATRRIVWNLEVPIGNSAAPRRTAPTGWIASDARRSNQRLAFVPIPWSTIDTLVAGLSSGAPAPLRPGAKISLKVQASDLRFGTPEDTEKRLTEVFKKRFQTDGIELADGQPIVLNVRYRETEGGTLVERNSSSGSTSGRSIQSTKSIVAMEMTFANSGKPIWSHEINYEPRIASMRGKEVSDAAARDATFSQLLYSIRSVPIPYYVTPDGSGVLPGTTKLEE
jgi:WD40 repeat protein